MPSDLAQRLRLSPEELRRRYEPERLGIQTTADLEPLDGIVGQDRAVAAIRFGLGMPSAAGFNIYVAGPEGIGKMTAVEAFLKAASAHEQVPPDICYVNRMEDSYEPRALALPTGKGRVFRDQMRKLIETIIDEVPRAFEDDEYQLARREIDKDLSGERSEVLEALEEKARECKHHIKLTPMGFLMVPVFGERELDESALEELPEATRDEFETKGEELKETIHEVLKQIRKVERAAKESREALDRKVALYALGHRIEALIKEYPDHEGVRAYLEEVQDSLLRWVEVMRRESEGEVELNVSAYEVNVLVDNAQTEGAPVIVERNPTFSNLCGRIEKESEIGGVFSTDFRMIRSGSLHRANGGYLVIPVEPLLRSPFSYDGLKRAIQAGELQIEEPTERLGLISTKSLRPDPIPLKVKVVLVGPWELYYLLHRHDSEFAELFKVKADFDTRIAASETSVHEFLRFLRRLTEAEQLRPVDAAAAARLLEHSTRMAGDRDKLSMLFGKLSDVVREADYWAREAEAQTIGAAHVERALEQQLYRDNLIEARQLELIETGTLTIPTTGQAIGQLNGLSVLQLGAFRFGRPCRITASVAVGQEGVVDIERKVELGGKIHSKGVLLIEGYLLGTYARERPLTLSARLAFEQSYDEIDGDSASSAELYVLLSALARAPLDQGIAVTGAIDQRGRVQAVGGLNEKIEGFFDACRLHELTGKQGVIIPRANVRHLHLREDVVDAVRAGRFHVWAVESIDEGLALLTGQSPGFRGPDGAFTPGSLHARIDAALADFTGALLEQDALKDQHRKKVQLSASLHQPPSA